MKEILKNLKLPVQINISIGVSIFTTVIIMLMFYFVTNIFLNIVNTDMKFQLKIRSISKSIENDLRYLEHLTIYNSIENVEQYVTKSEDIYKRLLDNLECLERSSFFHDVSSSNTIIKKIKTRVIGYKAISDSLKSELQEDNKDGFYAILALVSAGQKISYELEELNNIITKIAIDNIKKTELKIDRIKFFSSLLIIALLFFTLYINKVVVSSILYKINNLKKEVVSFFELLSHKREDTFHIKYDGKDEISEIAKIIDEHMYIAEKVLMQEREYSKEIELKVKEATKEIEQLNDEIEATQREVVFTMGAIAEERSKETSDHIKRVAEYSSILAHLYGLSLEEALLLKNASPMHDIGKIGIPDAILNKPENFTDSEYEIMKTHTVIGYKMLKHSDKSILKAASIVAYEHHERWDGKGYPRGLKGNEIHIYGRITAIADIFDALSSDRVYKKAWPMDKIIELFKNEKGKHFDPELVDIFLENIDYFLAAKHKIEKDTDSTFSSYIEDFDNIDKYL